MLILPHFNPSSSTGYLRMKSKDEEYVERREIELSKTINYSVDDENGLIKKIVINNYRDIERLNEIINTASWVFSRMLEKTR